MLYTKERCGHGGESKIKDLLYFSEFFSSARPHFTMREVHPLNGKNGRAKLNASDENLNPPRASMKKIKQKKPNMYTNKDDNTVSSSNLNEKLILDDDTRV